MSILENCKNFHLEKFQKFPFWKIPIIFNSENFQNFTISKKKQIFKILQFLKLSKLHKYPILWAVIYFEYSNNLNKYKNEI